ncbi:N-acetylmuramoyl-L-alanine amidase, partial [candidate division KSB1 bacterium]|nr:N-acetylmuramoyl-L-alanine amidase [candidate division KSB1 bacterium]
QDVYPQLDDEQFILSAIAQSEFTRESEELAAMLQATTTRRTGLSDRGVKQAGYYVLIGASMPNILFETAFISNKNEEKKLNSATYQQQFAEGILESVRLFKQKYEKSNSGYSTD